jgi:ATP-dependent exoDNAse (exonuclease V) beta subunit
MSGTSKIQEELIAAVGYKWNTVMSDSDNRLELVKAVDRLPDADWDTLSKPAQEYASEVGKAVKKAKPIPAPPDLVESKKAKAKPVEEAEEAPAPKKKAKPVEEAEEAPAPKKAKAKPVEEAEAEEAEEAPAPKKAKAKPVEEAEEAPAPKKAKAKPVEEAEEAPAPKKAKAKAAKGDRESDPERGKTVYTFRELTLLNPDWKKAEVAAECARLGYPVTPSTASLLWYGTRHTRKVMEDLNLI